MYSSPARSFPTFANYNSVYSLFRAIPLYLKIPTVEANHHDELVHDARRSSKRRMRACVSCLYSSSLISASFSILLVIASSSAAFAAVEASIKAKVSFKSSSRSS